MAGLGTNSLITNVPGGNDVAEGVVEAAGVSGAFVAESLSDVSEVFDELDEPLFAAAVEAPVAAFVDVSVAEPSSVVASVPVVDGVGEVDVFELAGSLVDGFVVDVDPSASVALPEAESVGASVFALELVEGSVDVVVGGVFVGDVAVEFVSLACPVLVEVSSPVVGSFVWVDGSADEEFPVSVVEF